MASGEKQGYRFTLTGTPIGYTISAVPIAFGSTGCVRSFRISRWWFGKTMARSLLLLIVKR